ncbi:unnamed protein product [Paramecium sonneborni]|uniref:Tetratricopeptide repeat protein n=1 Tax=Paramecium sonneborni TaxID=65129 RepID=A0A8S1N055_9CILI|nr:unnamed protein product [Paramecium sonneborni]
MDPEYLCTIANHSEEPIIAFCFNLECEKPRKVCFQCFQTNHAKHQGDCLRFNQVYSMIQNCIQLLVQMETSEQKKMENIIKLFKKNIKFITSEKDKLIELNSRIKQQDYQQIFEQLEQLKQWRNVSLSKFVKNSDISIQVDEIKKFEKSFDQFYSQYSKVDDIIIQSNDQNEQNTNERNPNIQNQSKQIKSENLAIQCLSSAAELYKQEQFQEALKFANQALKIDSNIEQAYLIKGLSLLHLDQYEEAIDSFDECLRQNLKIETVYYHKGYCLSVLEHYDDAIKCYDQALELKQDPDFYLKKAQTLHQQQKYQLALETINKALDMKSKQPYWQIKGAILHQLGNPNEELNCYLKALEFDQNQSSINHNIGVALYSLQRYQESLIYFDVALNLEPNSPDSFNQKGMSLQALNKHLLAIACFDSAIKCREKASYLINKAQSLIALKKQKEALDIYEYVREKYGE